MDKTTIMEIALVVIGFSFIALSVYLWSNYPEYYYVNFVCFFGGLGFIRYGLKYRDRDKINKEIKEEHEYWKKTPWSNGQVIGIIALILFFTSIGIGFVSAYVVKNLSLVGLFLLLLVISVLMAFVSSILVREERRKDREKKMYGHQE